MNKRTNKTTLQTTSFIDINEKTPVFEEGMHPLELYVQGTLDQRINILLTRIRLPLRRNDHESLFP